MDTAVGLNLTFDARQHKKTTSSVLKSIMAPGTHQRHQSRDQRYPDAIGQNASPTRQVVPVGKVVLPPGQFHMRLQTNEELPNRDLLRSSPAKPIEVYEDKTKPWDVQKKGRNYTSIKSVVDGESGRTAEDRLAKNSEKTKPKKSKSSTSLSALLSKAKPSKDLAMNYETQQKDKENRTPPRSSDAAPAPPIWAQFATQPTKESPATRKVSLNNTRDIHEEMALYTPRDYSPSKQRNFHDYQPNLSRKLESKPRPKSAFLSTDHSTASFTETLSKLRNINKFPPHPDGQKQVLQSRKSVENERGSPSYDESSGRVFRKEHRKVSNDSTKPSVTTWKPGSRVMAVVAAFNGKAKGSVREPERESPKIPLDVKAIENAFESLLDSRNVPQQTRDKMRALDTNIKADFLKQDKSGSGSARKADEFSPPNVGGMTINRPGSWRRSKTDEGPVSGDQGGPDSAAVEESPRKSRSRSRTFTLGKGRSSSKKQKPERSPSRGRPKSTDLTPPDSTDPVTSSVAAQAFSFVTKPAKLVGPEDYIHYLRKVQLPALIEVGKMHKLRQMLRNETVAWVDMFITRGGMTEIVGLLYRIIKVEWREEHEDLLMHETLLCLKALCTTSLALDQLAAIHSTLFPVLLAMLFDDEKKGPSEFTTRNIITSLLFTYLSAAPPSDLPSRARALLSHLRDPVPPEASQPPGFIASMCRPRPYRMWAREMTNVTKEVFWIFIHHSNIIPCSADGDTADKSYVTKHFPRDRPPVAAAPHVGGVEWDATNYLASHLDLINGIIASLPSCQERNDLRRELNDCGVEKCLGASWRTCKEKFYGAIHIGLATWIGAAIEDGWDVKLVQVGPDAEESLRISPRKKKTGADDGPPRLEMPKLDLEGRRGEAVGGDACGWL